MATWPGRETAASIRRLKSPGTKMGKVLGQWRMFARNCSLTLLVFRALTYMHHPNFLGGAASVNAEVASVTKQIRQSQSIAPIAIRNYLPYGVRGMFAAIMLFAAMACDTSYMHSWGSIFVQDVLLPIRQRWNRPPLSPQEHLHGFAAASLASAPSRSLSASSGGRTITSSCSWPSPARSSSAVREFALWAASTGNAERPPGLGRE